MRIFSRFLSLLAALPRIPLCVAGVGLLGWSYTMGGHLLAEFRWQAYRQEAEGKAVPLKLPVPDEAMASVENLAVTEGPFAPVRVAADGKPVDPPTLKNDLLPAEFMADLTRGTHADLMAARDCLQRCENVAGETLGGDSEPAIARALLAACDRQMGERWAQVLAAEAKPDAQFNIRYWPMPMAEKVPIANFRTAAQTHALRATALLHLGRGATAMEEVRGTLRLAEALRADPSLAIFMLRAVIVSQAMNVVWEGLNVGAWSDADLVALEGMLGKECVGLGYRRAVDTERGWVNAVCDALAVDPSRTILREWGTALEMRVPFPGMGHCQARVIRENQLMLNRHYDAVRERVDDQGNWSDVALPFVVERLGEAEKQRYRLAALAMVNFSKAEGRVLAVETRVRQARLAIALERYRRVKRELPVTLEVLAPGYLPAVLHDPMDGAPMRYARDAARAFRLWSIGDDREDDLGVADAQTSGMTLDTVWPGLVPGRKTEAAPKGGRPQMQGPRALRSLASVYAMR